MRFMLRTPEDRKRALREIWTVMLRDLTLGRIPTFHVVRVCADGSIFNHYMTPISLKPIDRSRSKAMFYLDFYFFLKLMLRLKRVSSVRYDPERPAVIFMYYEE